jgi:hypothetical protein
MPLPKKWSKTLTDLDMFAAEKDVAALEKEAKAAKKTSGSDAPLKAVNLVKQKFGNLKTFKNPKNPKPKEAASTVKMLIDLFNKAIDEVTTALEATPEESGWTPATSDLPLYGQLDSAQKKSVQSVLENYNGRGRGSHSHRGVGGKLTLDLTGPAWGGSGRGDWRLQVDTANQTLNIVNHQNKTWPG